MCDDNGSSDVNHLTRSHSKIHLSVVLGCTLIFAFEDKSEG